jgi:hypothetical protein
MKERIANALIFLGVAAMATAVVGCLVFGAISLFVHEPHDGYRY